MGNFDGAHTYLRKFVWNGHGHSTGGFSYNQYKLYPNETQDILKKQEISCKISSLKLQFPVIWIER